MKKPSVTKILIPFFAAVPTIPNLSSAATPYQDNATQLTSIYLSDSLEVISQVDFKSDSAQNIKDKIVQAQILLEKAKKNLEMTEATFSEVAD